MSVAVVIIAHDKIGTSIKDTAIALVGDCPIPIQSLELYKENDPDDFLEHAQKVVHEADQGDGVLVLTDIYGATPSNVCSRLENNGKLAVIAGLNLPMLVRAINYHSLDLGALTDKIVDGGRSSIMLCGQ